MSAEEEVTEKLENLSVEEDNDSNKPEESNVKEVTPEPAPTKVAENPFQAEERYDIDNSIMS